MDLLNKEQYEAAKMKVIEISYGVEMAQAMGPYDASCECNDLDELGAAIYKYEEANNLKCPHCGTLDSMGAGCYECADIELEDFL